ncbi:MAG: serine/threonine-protein kinase [Bryobacteraceae bacterium]|nr:serine/threonine-protein kinase [Bryobacteraceae bacterium]
MEGNKRIEELFEACFGRTPEEWDSILKDEGPEASRQVREWLASAEVPPEEAAHAADPRIGKRLGAYVVESCRGEGGFGKVYLGRADTDSSRPVAIKFLKETLSGLDRMLFRREQQALAKLSHPGIARFLDAGVTEDGEPYVVIEWIDGRPLTEYLAGREVREVIALFLKVCEAVRHAHQHFIVHRDLAPHNILVTPQGEVKIIDFGIAKLLDASSPADRTAGARPFSFPYASPEQVGTEATGLGADVYSLGAVLYELLTGEPLFPEPQTGGDPLPRWRDRARREMIRTSEPVPPSERTSSRGRTKQLRGDLDCILRKAVSKRPEDRYPSVEEFMEDLSRYSQCEPVRAHPDTTGYKIGKYVRKHSLAVFALGVSLAYCGVMAHRAALGFEAAFRDAYPARELTEVARQMLEQPVISELANKGALARLGPSIETHRYLLERMDQLRDDQLNSLVPALAQSWMRLAEVQAKRGEFPQAAAAAERAAARFQRMQQLYPGGSAWTTRAQAALALAARCRTAIGGAQ